jgi:hypothetical protein
VNISNKQQRGKANKNRKNADLESMRSEEAM